jgi:hypothetical protein
MRIEIADQNCIAHTITTEDPRIAGDWFAEICRKIMSVNSRFSDCRLSVWPSTHEEMDKIGEHQFVIDYDSLSHFAGKILEVTGAMI